MSYANWTADKVTSHKSLARMLEYAREIVPENSRWAHYKYAHIYTVSHLSFWEETMEVAVTYGSLIQGEYVSFTRKLSVFQEQVRCPETDMLTTRFVRIAK